MDEHLTIVQTQEEADRQKEIKNWAFNDGIDDALKINLGNGYMWDILSPHGRFYIICQKDFKDSYFSGSTFRSIDYLGDNQEFFDHVVEQFQL